MKFGIITIAIIFSLQINSFSQELSAFETRTYIRNMLNKTNGLNFIGATSKKSFVVKNGEFRKEDDGYRCSYFADDELYSFALIDLTILDHFELSPSQTEDSPVRFMRIFLSTASVSSRESGTTSTLNYFSFPFLNSGNNYEKLQKAFLHLAELERKSKPKDPFDN